MVSWYADAANVLMKNFSCVCLLPLALLFCFTVTAQDEPPAVTLLIENVRLVKKSGGKSGTIALE